MKTFHPNQQVRVTLPANNSFPKQTFDGLYVRLDPNLGHMVLLKYPLTGTKTVLGFHDHEIQEYVQAKLFQNS